MSGNPSELESCQVCQEGAGAAPAEMVTHFIFQCGAYTIQRHALVRAIGRENLDLKKIMLDSRRMITMMTYIDKTGRFNNEDMV